MFAVQESQRTMTRSVAVKRYLARWSVRIGGKRFPKKCLRCFDTAIFSEKKINGPALLVYRAIQVAPYPFDCEWSERPGVVELSPGLSSPNRTCTSQRIRLSIQVLLKAKAMSA